MNFISNYLRNESVRVSAFILGLYTVVDEFFELSDDIDSLVTGVVALLVGFAVREAVSPAHKVDAARSAGFDEAINLGQLREDVKSEFRAEADTYVNALADEHEGQVAHGADS